MASVVVAVFSSGWQLTSAKSIKARSTTTITLPAVSLMSANGVTEPGGTPSTFTEQLGAPEAETAEAKLFCERLQVDARVVLGDDEHHLSLLVDEEQALGVGARQCLPQRGRLRHREHRRVLDCRRANADLVEPGE